MRILHLTDTHLGVRAPVRGAPSGWSRADDHLAAFDTALRPALEGAVDLVVHSGDLFDCSRPPARAVQQAADRLLEVARRVPVVLIAGNHDRRGLKRWIPHARTGLHVVDRPVRVQVAGVALGAVPFVRHADSWAQAARTAVGPGVDLLVAHQAFHGAEVPGFTFRAGVQRDTVGAAHLPAGVGHVMCGHLHPRQVTHLGDCVVVQPGSTERTAFGERGQVKGYALWSLGRSVTWGFVDLPARPMRRVSRHAHLAQVRPGTLVRAETEALEHEVLARGGWLWGRPRTAVVRARAAPVDPQLRLWG